MGRTTFTAFTTNGEKIEPGNFSSKKKYINCRKFGAFFKHLNSILMHAVRYFLSTTVVVVDINRIKTTFEFNLDFYQAIKQICNLETHKHRNINKLSINNSFFILLLNLQFEKCLNHKLNKRVDLKGVFAKNERGCRLTTKNKRF